MDKQKLLKLNANVSKLRMYYMNICKKRSNSKTPMIKKHSDILDGNSQNNLVGLEMLLTTKLPQKAH